MSYDQSRIDEAVLALLGAYLFDVNRSWKGYDFEVMNRLHEAGYLFDPVGKQKSVHLTEDGIERGLELANNLFGPVDSTPSGPRRAAQLRVSTEHASRRARVF